MKTPKPDDNSSTPTPAKDYSNWKPSGSLAGHEITQEAWDRATREVEAAEEAKYAHLKVPTIFHEWDG